MNIQTYYSMGYYIAELDEADLPQDDLWYVDNLHITDDWCINTFGPQDLWDAEPVTGWKRMRNKYFFIDESKCTWFLLRWA